MFLSSLVAYQDLALLALRVALGVIFIYHGYPKLKGAKAMAAGIGMSTTTILLVGLAEFFGGLMVIFGIYEEVGALFLVIVMLGALYSKIVKWKSPFSAHDKMGWEFDVILLVAALVILTGLSGTLLQLA